MNTRRLINAVLIPVICLVMSGCGPSPALTYPPTLTPPATPTPSGPNSTEISVPADRVTPLPTPAPFANEEPATPELIGTYTINGTAPDGKDYSGKLIITLQSDNSNSSMKQAEYDLAWDTGSTGAGILIKDALANRFLATSFGGPTCGAVFYSAYSYVDGDTSTFSLYGIRLEPGTFDIGSETASPIVPRPYLEGDYNLVGYNANGSGYKGTLSITQQGNALWQLVWNVVLPTPGIGISLNKSLFAGAYGGEGCGVAVYNVNIDGSLRATWAVLGDDQVGEETATK